MEKDIKILSELFIKKYATEPTQITRLPGAGSGRSYYRLSDEGNVCIGVAGENLRDCRAFISLSRDFRREGINVPEVYGVDESGLYYIQEDLGDTSLFDLINRSNAGRADHDMETPEEREVVSLIEGAIRQLARMQCVDEKVWEEDVEYRPFSKRQVFWDLNYFKYEFLRPLAIDFDEDALENDFENFASDLKSYSFLADGFMYRDFQSRNVMVKDGKCFFIDFQGGRKGPAPYDAVSFLWQAKARFSDSFRKRMLEIYEEEYMILRPDADEAFEHISAFALFRTLQVLGAYGLRGLIEKKAHFLESIPSALLNFGELLEKGALDSYPELKKIGQTLIKDKRFLKTTSCKGRLTIEVFSFSYKKGYPADYSGNGGGFMFDCRGMHNPGRYEEYKPLTGMDAPVIEFLKGKGETDRFSDEAVSMVAPTIERYIQRGFSNLQIGFGCTGGRHRSVYCAERVASSLAEKFPEAYIVLHHREQNIKKEFNKEIQ